jgi:murein DD-endopeptidase MepM/ murein hydrolase activator NlpD
LKRAFTQKIGSVPSCASDNEGVTHLESKNNPQEQETFVRDLYPELTRRVRTSATTIGLAIAMAASGMLLSHQEQKAMAAAEFGIAKPTNALSNVGNNPVEKNSSASTRLPANKVEVPTTVVQEPTAVKTVEPKLALEPTAAIAKPESAKVASSSVSEPNAVAVPQPSEAEVLSKSTKSEDKLETTDSEIQRMSKNPTSESKAVGQDSSVSGDSIAKDLQTNELEAEIEILKQGTGVETLVAQATPEGIPINVPEPDKAPAKEPSSEAIPATVSKDNRSEFDTTAAIDIPVPQPDNSLVEEESDSNSMQANASQLKTPNSPTNIRRISVPSQPSTPIRVNEKENLPNQAERIEIPVPTPATNFVPNQRGGHGVATGPAGSDNYNPALPNSESPQQPKDRFLNPSNGVTYSWPVSGVVTSGFGRRWGRLHAGIDLAAAVGTPVRASAPGIVVKSKWSGGYGNLVEIRHADGSVTRYGHNSQLFVQEGQEVQQGDVICNSGNTGRSTGPHVHFEIRPDGKQAVNPMAFLPRRNS